MDSSPADRDRQGWFLWCLGTFADPPLGPVMIKASFAAQLGPSCAQANMEETVTNCGLMVALNRLLRVRALTLLTPTSDTSGTYPKKEPSRQAPNSAETNSSVLLHCFCNFFSFLWPLNYFFNFSFIFVVLFLISLILILDILTPFFLPPSFFYFCYSSSFFVPFFCFPHSIITYTSSLSFLLSKSLFFLLVLS